MVLRSHGLRDAFEAQGEAGFMAWSYGTYDPLEAVLEPGYFASFGRFRPGDLIYVGTSPRPDNSPWTTQHGGTEIRRALLMIRGKCSCQPKKSHKCQLKMSHFGGDGAQLSR
jgi:hypothetical protein